MLSNPATTPRRESGAVQTIYSIRQSRLIAAIKGAGLDGLALNPGPSLTYLTGLNFHLMERPVVAIFTPHAPPVLALPELETGKTSDLAYAVQIFAYGEDPSGWPAVFRQAALEAGIEDRLVGVEPRRLRVLELRLLETAAPGAQFISAEESLAGLRMHKEESELAAMRKAVEIAQLALQATLPQVKPGITERQLAAELTLHLLRSGADPELPFSPIVSFGPNTANPHATLTDRPLAQGDLVLIDWGAAWEGYMSDLTRTFAFGQVEPELRRIAQVVQAANAAGVAAARPGAAADEVDRAARSVIEQAGYGQYFIHRTGHGLGMEAHEEPYIRAGNLQPLASGMTFTIEPGIYLPGRGGVRIEDDVVVTAKGAESLSDLPRDLVVLKV